MTFKGKFMFISTCHDQYDFRRNQGCEMDQIKSSLTNVLSNCEMCRTSYLIVTHTRKMEKYVKCIHQH